MKTYKRIWKGVDKDDPIKRSARTAMAGTKAISKPSWKSEII
jgi:hypothetical protein